MATRPIHPIPAIPPAAMVEVERIHNVVWAYERGWIRRDEMWAMLYHIWSEESHGQ